MQQNIRTHQSQLLGSEQRANSFGGELSKISFYNLRGGKFLFINNGRGATNFVQDILTQPCLLSVLVCDAVNSSYRLCLPTLGQQEFRGLIQVEQEKSAGEHN